MFDALKLIEKMWKQAETDAHRIRQAMIKIIEGETHTEAIMTCPNNGTTS